VSLNLPAGNYLRVADSRVERPAQANEISGPHSTDLYVHLLPLSGNIDGYKFPHLRQDESEDRKMSLSDNISSIVGEKSGNS
ncbi:hypothetical protein L9F63_027288, partial [Diploptera punctata]